MAQNPARPDWERYYVVVQDYIVKVEQEFKFTAAEMEL
jgi:hypothetical protein